jgi:hypothetical protein
MYNLLKTTSMASSKVDFVGLRSKRGRGVVPNQPLSLTIFCPSSRCDVYTFLSKRGHANTSFFLFVVCSTHTGSQEIQREPEPTEPPFENALA